ncbi:hypothetical protein [Tenacibaculum jejuense]|uniref:Putative Membrane protein n=1 Tax=Tenacibaculum jejuense TaxID=584609 RepID=A0A238UDV1_9FLAO|nr:hypothetical protein [Tenacibaculum jejuense]SNR16768.1 putative Membrane protein [Tenacibaculum jejuense]
MEKSIEKIWNEAFVDEQSLIAPRINNLYNQKSKSIVNKIKRTYEFDNKGLLPMAGIVAIGGILLSETIIGLYGTILILCLYYYNTKLLSRFSNLDVKSDNLTYLKNYRKVIKSVSLATKRMFIFVIPFVVLSIFILAFFVKEKSFLSLFIKEETTLLEIIGIGGSVALIVSILAMLVFKLSTKLLYGTLFSKLDDLINEIEGLKNK